MRIEDYEIDEFEKLYALTSVKVNSPSVISDNTFRYEDFDKICTLAKYKLEHREQFRDVNQEINESEENFYMIPRQVIQKARYGNEEVELIKEINILSDSAGNGLYIVMDNGNVRMTKELRDEIEFGKLRYARAIGSGRILAKEIEELFEFDNINQIVEEIKTGELSLDKVQEKIDSLAKSRGLRPMARYVNEISVKNRDDDEPQEELEPPKDEEIGDEELDEEKNDDEEVLEEEGRAVTDEEEEPNIEEEAATIGISVSMVEMLAERYKCKPSQINFRKIEDYEKLQEDTGLNLRQYRGKVWAMKLDYGIQEKYYLINGETGERFEDKTRVNDGTITEVQDYFKYPTRVGENARSLRNDEGRSYITYLDENGDMKEMKYINNGRREDMLREERQRYIAEVAKVNEILQDAIDIYQKDNTQENWLRVKSAMEARVAVDRKYRIKERDFDNQRNNTIETLKETIDETKKDTRSIEDDEDDWGPWSSHMRH